MVSSAYANEAVQAVMDTDRGTPPWYQRLVDGYFALRDQYAKPHWDIARELFELEQFSGIQSSPTFGLVEVQPPRVFGLVHALESQIFNRVPKFYVEPLRAQSEDLARWCEVAVNAQWYRDSKLHDETRAVLRDCILTGWGWMMSGVEVDFAAARKARRARMKRAEEMQKDPALGVIAGEVLGEFAAGTDSVNVPETTGTYEMHSLQWHRRVFSKRVSPLEVFVDPNARSLDDARWVGRLIVADIEQVKANTNFQNTEGLRPSKVFSAIPEARAQQAQQEIAGGAKTGAMYGMRLVPDAYQFVALYELFERQGDGTWDKIVFAHDHPKPLQMVKDAYAIGCPYRLLRWNQTGERIFAISDVQAVMTQVIEEREIRTRLHDQYMRSAVDTYVMNRQLFPTPEDLHPMTVPGIGMVYTGNFDGHTRQQVMDLLPRNPQTGEAMNYLALIERNIEQGTGLGPNQQAAPLKSETSATEAAEIAKWATNRGQSKYDAFNHFVAGVAQDNIGLHAEFSTPEDMAVYGGVEAAKLWNREKFTDADIQFGLSIKVEQGSTQPRSDAQRVAAMQTVMTMLSGPAGVLWAQKFNVTEVLNEWARGMGFQTGSKLLNPEMGDEAFSEMAAQMMLMQGGAMGAGSAPRGATAPSGEAGMAQMGGAEL